MVPSESFPDRVPRRGLVAFIGHEADRTVVWLRGEHDPATVDALREIMVRATTLDDADVVLDLTGLQFMDASTVGVFVRSQNFLRSRSRSLVLRSPSSMARRVLDVVGLTDLIEPGSIEETQLFGAADALGTWVAVPATDPVDRPDVVPVEPAIAQEPVRAGLEQPAAQAVVGLER